MIVVHFEIAHPVTGKRGVLRIGGGVWTGDVCGFEFTDTVHGIAGSAACDWRKPAPLLRLDEGDPDDPAVQPLLDKIKTLLLPFHRGAFRGVSDDQLAALYAGDYHRSMNYAMESKLEADFKSHVVDQLLRLCQPQKLLDAGCSAGEVVRQLRTRGVDTYGFDLCPDIEKVAYRDVAPWIRHGSIDAIPFGSEDGFDTLIALDVFEHVPEHKIGPMVSEFARLGVQRVVAHIAHCEFQYPGHVTLRPLSWWDRQMAPWFQRVLPAAQPIVAGAFSRRSVALPARLRTRRSGGHGLTAPRVRA